MVLRCVVIAFCFFLTGCSTLSFGDLFASYSNQLAPVRQAIEHNNLPLAQTNLAQYTPAHNNYLLNQLEQGRVAALAHNYPQSQQHFEAVYQGVKKHQQGAKFRLSQGVSQTGALLANDSVIGYLPAPYEMEMLHSYKALNYLYQQNKPAAMVEVRRANQIQRTAEQNYQRAVNQYKKEDAHLPSMDKLVGQLKNGFHNAFSFYLSGLLYQSEGQADEAYIDYKKALSIQPDNPYLQQDVARLAQQFSTTRAPSINAPKANQGEVIIFVEQGLVPALQQYRLQLPLYTSQRDMRFYSLAIPMYYNTPYLVPYSQISIDKTAYQLAPLVALESLAAKHLEQHTPARISRQALRLVAKEQMRRKLAKEGGDVGNVLANLYNLASEQADTRSWQTLPNQIAMVRLTLNQGEHQLGFPSLAQAVSFNVVQQRLTLIYLTSVNQYANAQVVQL